MIIALALLATSTAHAQIGNPGGRTPRAPSIDPSRFGFGVALQHAIPQGALRASVGSGNGISGHLTYYVNAAGTIAIRAEAGVFDHNDGRTNVLVPRDVGGETFSTARILTSSRSSCIGLGAQLSRRLGLLRPNLSLTYSRARFETESYVSDLPAGSGIIYGSSSSDVSYAWTAGAGIDIPLDQRSLAVLDVGARYTFGGKGTWLHDGDIQPTGPNEYRLNPTREGFELVAIAVGMRIDILRLIQR
jgi:hypothetical protein